MVHSIDSSAGIIQRFTCWAVSYTHLDALAGQQIHHFNVGDTVRVVGLVRGGQGRVNIDGLFAQEDDVLEFLVTPQGIHDLHHLLQGDLK